MPGTISLSTPKLAEMTPAEVTFADMWATGTYGAVHPIEHIRELLDEQRGGPGISQTGD